jgi:type IV pilus assembly protein PilF
MSRRAPWLPAALLLLGSAGALGAQEVDLEKAAAVNAELAITYMKQGNLRAAREKIDRALEQNPRTADTQMVAGFIYDRLGEDKKAASHYEQAVKLAGKNNPDVLNNAAVFLCR